MWIIASLDMPNKIVQSFSDLEKLVETYRQQNKKLVLTQGSFDMVHIGHGRYLDAAKKLGDVLIIGIDSDEKIRFRKGPDRPVVPQEERLEMLTYLTSVDHVLLKELDQPKWQLIKTISPDVLVATKETYKPEQIEQLKEYCGEVVVLEPKATTSTSAKIRRIQLNIVSKIENLLEELKNA